MIPSVPFLAARTRQLWQLLFLLVLAALCGPARAAIINFNGAASTISNCTYSNQVYTCSSLAQLGDTDVVAIASGYTVKVSSNIGFTYNQSLQMSGTASLQSDTGSLSLSSINPANLKVSGGTLAAKTDVGIGKSTQPITANISSTSGTVTLGNQAIVVGAVSGTSIVANYQSAVTGPLNATGSILLGNETVIKGPVSAANISADFKSSISGSMTATGSITLDNEVVVNGAISATTISTSFQDKITGSLTATGSITLANEVVVNGAVSAGTTLVAKYQAQVNGDVTAKYIATENEVLFNGNVATESMTLAWHARVTQVVTCTKSSTAGCSCVSDGSGYTGSYAPVCQPGLGTGPHHIQISHPGTALTCQPQTVTLTACANSACTAPNYTSSVTVALSPGGGNVTISGGVNSAATVSQGSAGTATLGAAAPGISNPTVCVNTANSGASNQCAMAFSDTGLSLDVANHIAGTTAVLTVAALQKSGNNQSCVPLFAGVSNASVNLACSYVNPVSSKAAAVPVKVGSTWLASSATSQCSSSGQAVPLSFNSSGVATANLVYAEAGQVGLSASYTGTNAPYVGLKATGATTFIAAPSSFNFVSTGLASGNINAGNASDASSAVFLGAGAPFKVRVEARNSAGTLTSNFGQESSPPAVSYTASLVAPLAASEAASYTWPAFVAPSGTFPAFSNGVAEANPMTWNEVGIFKLAADLASKSYLGTGFNVTGSSNIGRFIPDHFNVSIVSANGVPMACTAAACPASQQAVYSHQPFNVTVGAMGAADNVLNYYQGSFAKPVTLSGWASAGATAVSEQNPPATPTGNSMAGSIAAASFVRGAAAGTGIQYKFANISPAAAATARAAPTNVYIRAIDSDGASSARGASSVEPGLRVLSGRLVVAHAYGSELTPMPLQARAQYWSGSSYVNNPADNNQTGYALASADLLLASCTKDLQTGGVCLSTLALEQATTLRFAGGVAPFRLRAPGKQGSVDVSLKDSVINFLPAATGKGTVQFGVYRSGPVLYLREVY